jgi:hypothetical protein
MNLVDGSGGAPASDVAVVPSNGDWPMSLCATRQDELQLVLDRLQQGKLNLSDYLLEMYERASMYFHQIGLQHCPPQRVEQIRILHSKAQQVRPQLSQGAPHRPLLPCMTFRCSQGQHTHMVVPRALQACSERSTSHQQLRELHRWEAAVSNTYQQ